MKASKCPFCQFVRKGVCPITTQSISDINSDNCLAYMPQQPDVHIQDVAVFPPSNNMTYERTDENSHH